MARPLSSGAISNQQPCQGLITRGKRQQVGVGAEGAEDQVGFGFIEPEQRQENPFTTRPGFSIAEAGSFSNDPALRRATRRGSNVENDDLRRNLVFWSNGCFSWSAVRRSRPRAQGGEH